MSTALALSASGTCQGPREGKGRSPQLMVQVRARERHKLATVGRDSYSRVVVGTQRKDRSTYVSGMVIAV